MTVFDIKKREMKEILQRVRNDCDILIARTYDFEADLMGVNNEEEAKEFDRTHDLEEGLMYIRLFD